MDKNPYAPPESNVDKEVDEPTRLREQHITHEASIQSIGGFYYLGALIFIIMLIFAFSTKSSQQLYADFGKLGAWVLLAMTLMVAGFGIRQLKPWSRIPTTIFCLIGLIGFPLGTVVNSYFLYLLYSPKGRMIFSEEYAQIIRDTPQVKYKTSPIVKIFFALFILLIIAAVILAVTQQR